MLHIDRRAIALTLGAGLAFNLALLMVCYGFALQLPLFFDDPPVLSWVDAHTLSDVWTTANENDYYRPLTFTLYWLSGALEPQARAIALHGLNLGLHFVSGCLLMLAARCLKVKPATALLASTLLTVFPFLFQAVPWVTTLPHFLASALTLLAIYAFLRGAIDDRAGWHLIALAATLFAPLAHESGVIAGVLVAVVAFGEASIRRRPVNRVWALAGILANLAVIWLRLRIPGVAVNESIQPGNWLQNGFFFLQGLIYPFGPLAGRLVFEEKLNDFLVVGVLALMLAIGGVGIALRSRDGKWLARGLAWWLIAALPSWLMLKFSYNYISPRLYALAAPGLALLWAELFTRLAELARGIRWQRIALILLGSALLIQNVDFLLRQRQLHLDLGGVYQAVLQAASDPGNAPLLFVNLPSWLARSQQVYPLSTDGVLFLPGYSDLAAFIRANSGRAVQASTVMFTPVMQVTDDYFGRSGEGKDWESMRDAAAAARSVYLAVYREGRFQVQVVGRLEEAQPAPADHPQVAFEAGPLIMTSAARQVEPGRWAITLDWYARGSLADHEIFVHVVDASGQAVAQSDGPALGGMLPIWNWRSGDRIRDVRYVELAERDNGPYTVRVGVYATSGERIPATSENGAPYADGAATIVTLRP